MGFEQIRAELTDFMGRDRKIAEVAWTSSTKNELKVDKTNEQAFKLVKSLSAEGHTSPLESVVFTFWMRIPIMIDRQVVTHRFASHNGMSGRYRTLPDEFYLLPNDVVEIYNKSNLPLSDMYVDTCTKSVECYKQTMDELKRMKKDGIITNDEYKRAREDARGVLPEALMVERITTINLHSFANFMRLRSSDYAQKEINVLANLLLAEVEKANVIPVALEQLKAQGWRTDDEVLKLKERIAQLEAELNTKPEAIYVYT